MEEDEGTGWEHRTRLAGYRTKHMQPKFKTKMLVYQLKADVDEKILPGKSSHL